MRSRYLLILALFCCISAFADQVSRSTALQTAKAFMQGKGKSIKASVPSFSAPLKNAAKDAASYYVFNADGGKGYVIVSGDDRTIPVLGYSLNGTFDSSNIPSNMKAWLQSYADEIAALKDAPAASSTAGNNGFGKTSALPVDPIEPLIKTYWNQSTPYWNNCPVWDGQRCYTGCVATSMAQVMNYHKWPAATTAEIPAYTTLNHGISMPAIPAGTAIDWENMLEAYGEYVDNNDSYLEKSYTDEQAQAIANLMLYCGTSLEMNYGIDSDGGSAAFSVNVAKALKEYFDYDENLYCAQRSNYSIAEWNSLLLSELSKGRPIVYSGQSSGGGHSFVIDGYEGEETGYFHVNWGWGGLANGYFAISVLNPYSTIGAGASSSSDGFTASQDAIIGVQKKGATESITPEVYRNSLSFEDINLTGDVLSFDFWNMTGQDAVFCLGLLIDDNNGNTIDHPFVSGEILSGYGWNDYECDLSFMKSEEAGTYKLYLYGEKSVESLTTEGRRIYVEVTVDENSNMTCVLHPTKILSLVEIPQPAELPTVDRSQWLKAKIKNNGDEYNDMLYFFADPVSASTRTLSMQSGAAIPVGETVEIEFYVTPTVVENYNIIISTDLAGNNVIGSGVLKMVADPDPEPEPVVDLSVDGTPTIPVSIVANEQFNISVPIKNNGDNFADTIFVKYSTDGGVTLTDLTKNTIEIETSATGTLEITSTLENAGDYKLYLFAGKPSNEVTAGDAFYTFDITVSEPAPQPAASLSVSNLNIPSSITTGTDFEVSMTITSTGGSFSDNVNVYYTVGAASSTKTLLNSYPYTLAEDESAPLTLPLNFATVGKYTFYLYAGDAEEAFASFSFTVTSSVAPGESGQGDADGNGVVDVSDVVTVVNYISTGVSSAINKQNADVNGDGRINVTDAIEIVRRIIE